MSKVIIDMKTRTVTIGDITIDMEKQQVTIGEVEVEVRTWDETLPAKIVKTEGDHEPVKAEQRKKFKENREDLVGTSVIMPDGDVWDVEKHIKGTHYVVKRNYVEGATRPTGGTGPTRLGTMRIKKRHASHNRKKDEWLWWEDRVRRTGSGGRVKGGDHLPHCSICGMVGKYASTCESVKTSGGEWLLQHREITQQDGEVR